MGRWISDALPLRPCCIGNALFMGSEPEGLLIFHLLGGTVLPWPDSP